METATSNSSTWAKASEEIRFPARFFPPSAWNLLHRKWFWGNQPTVKRICGVPVSFFTFSSGEFHQSSLWRKNNCLVGVARDSVLSQLSDPFGVFSGVSPFLDETVEETTGHILQCDFFYAYEHFADVSNEAKSLVSAMIQPLPQQRLNAASCLLDPWFENVSHSNVTVNLFLYFSSTFYFLFFFLQEGGHVWKTEKLKKFVERRHTVTLANSTHA